MEPRRGRDARRAPAVRGGRTPMIARSAVDVIVVNFNSSLLARRCVESAAEDLGAWPWRAIVVDNASSDGGAAALASLASTTVIANSSNAGFGAAVNQAAAVSDAPLLWIL